MRKKVITPKVLENIGHGLKYACGAMTIYAASDHQFGLMLFTGAAATFGEFLVRHYGKTEKVEKEKGA